jgi:hypothetical protein
MANSNFKVRHGLNIGDSVSILDTGAATGLTFTELNVDNININGNTISSTNTNGDILITPNGTGDVDLVTDTVVVGDANATATITTNGTGDLILNTNAGTNAGSITLANGANSNITLAPNGTGDIALTLANGGNLTNTRNYITGAIRNATTEGLGDIWALNASTTTSPFRGVSLDNSADTAKGPATVLRSYSGGAVAGAGTRGRLVFERSRGTAASPSAVQSGDQIGSIDATGYTSTGWINDTLTVVPGFFGFTAAENWVSNTNLGLVFSLSLAPTATTITTNTNLVQTLLISPQSSIQRSDTFTFRQGKTGTTDLMTIDVSGNVAVTGDLRVNGNDIRSSGNTSQIVMSSAGATLELRGDNIQLENAAGTSIVGNNITYNRVYGQWEYNTTITAAAANTAYVFPLGTATFNNIATVGSTSRLIIGAAGIYNLQFSVQLDNDNSQEHTAYIWLRKNGTDIVGSTGRVTVVRQGSTITGWNFLIDSANTTDYYEIAYAVDDVLLTFPAYAATAFAPSTVALVTTLTPVGA